MTTNDEIILEFRVFVEGQLDNLNRLIYNSQPEPSQPTIFDWFPHDKGNSLRYTLYSEWRNITTHWEYQYIAYQSVSKILFYERDSADTIGYARNRFNWLTVREANLLYETVGDIAEFLGTSGDNLLFSVEWGKINDGMRRGFEGNIRQILKRLEEKSETIIANALVTSTEQSGYEE